MFSLMANCFTWIKKRREPIKKVTLLMVGLDNAGKTSTIADMKGDTTDGITPTVGFLTSSFTLNRFNVTIFDLGGGVKIRDIWKKYYAEVFGIVYVVDASDINRLEESKEVLHKVKSNPRISGKPLLVLANKQDVDGALNEVDIVHHLDLTSLVQKHKCACQVYTCTAVLGQSNKIDKQIKKGFQWLLGSISENFGSLSERVAKDMVEQKEEQARDLEAKRERVRKAQEERERAEREAADKVKKVDEESDDGLVIGKGKKLSSSPEACSSQPDNQNIKKMKKKKKKKKRLDLEDEEQEASSYSKLHRGEGDGEDESGRTRSPPLFEQQSKAVIDSAEELQPLSNTEENGGTENVETKKKKKKKKKRRANKTAPAPEETGDEPAGMLPPLAWNTPPSTLNGFSGSRSISPRRLEPLAPLSGRHSLSPTPPMGNNNDEESMQLAPLRTAKSWTRTRPNSEDGDVMT